MIRILLVLIALISAGCATTGGADEEADPTLIEAAVVPDPPAEVTASNPEPESKQQEGEVPLAVAETEQAENFSVDELQAGNRMHDKAAENAFAALARDGCAAEDEKVHQDEHDKDAWNRLVEAGGDGFARAEG